MSKTILVVDDDAMIRRIVRAGLETVGHTVFELEEGSKVLRMVNSIGIDLIILDMIMEGKEGMETAFELKEFHPTLPIIVISSDSTYIEMASHIADGIMKKPILVSELRELITRFTSK